MVAHQRSPQLFKNSFSSWRQHSLLPLVPIHCLQEGRESFGNRRNDPRKAHLSANTTNKLRPLSQARHPTRREDLNLGAPNASSPELYPRGSTGKGGPGDASGDEGTGDGDSGLSGISSGINFYCPNRHASFSYRLLLKIFIIGIIHPTTRKHQTMKIRPPCS